MLIEFRVENHRSIRDEQVLSMEAGRVGDENDPRPRKVEGYAKKLLPVAALYGANASGKSNVLSALAFMRVAVSDSHRFWTPEGGVPRFQFAWGPKATEPSLFEVTILLDKVRYQYGFVATDAAFSEEWLHAWPHGKKQVWFAREGKRFRFGDSLRGENRLIEEITRPNALFLASAAQNKHSQLTPIFQWFETVLPVRLSRSQVPHHYLRESLALEFLLDTSRSDRGRRVSFADDVDFEPLLRRFQILLKSADIGVVDVKVDWTESDNSRQHRRRPKFRLKHHDFDEASWLPLEEESHGTQTLFDLALPVLVALEDGRPLILDELEAGLHPSLARKIIDVFNSPVTNPHNAQLIFTTHDTNLLGSTIDEPALRRDQVWFTEKDKEGATALYPLTDYQPRKAENMERGYLQGRYGAIPYLGEFNFMGK